MIFLSKYGIISAFLRVIIMTYERLINSLFRLPIKKAYELFKDYENNIVFNSPLERQYAMDILNYKEDTKKTIGDEVYALVFKYLTFMHYEDIRSNNEFLKQIRNLPMFVYFECIGNMSIGQIFSLLDHSLNILPSPMVEACIVNLPDELQVDAISKYRKGIKPRNDYFNNFSYAVCEEARLKLKELFPKYVIDDDSSRFKNVNKDKLKKIYR